MFSCESVIAPRLLDSVVQCFQEWPDLAINIFIFLWVIAPLVELMLSYPITVKKNNIYPLTNIMLLSTQISTLILKVDLACHKCYNKIRKILCNLQGKKDLSILYNSTTPS